MTDGSQLESQSTIFDTYRENATLARIKGHGWSIAGIDRMTGQYRIMRGRSVRTDVDVTNRVVITDFWVKRNGNFVPFTEWKESVNWRMKNQLDATYYFTVLLIGWTCFGHYYAHNQELSTIMLITTLVVSFCKDGEVSVSVKLWFFVVCVRCEVVCRFVVAVVAQALLQPNRT